MQADLKYSKPIRALLVNSLYHHTKHSTCISMSDYSRDFMGETTWTSKSIMS